MCVIYLSAAEASGDDIKMLAGLKKKFTSQLEGRGTSFKWMWMNMAVEDTFKELFAPEELPSALLVVDVRDL